MNEKTAKLPLCKFDRVLIDGQWRAEVVIASSDRSLLAHARSDGQQGVEQDWYDTDRLTLVARRRERATGHEPERVRLY